MSSRLSSNSEANISELLESRGYMFPRYIIVVGHEQNNV